MFDIGQFVIHPRYGASKVTELTQLFICEISQDCYVIHPILEEITIKIPIKSVEIVGIRPPLPSNELLEMLGFLSEPFNESAEQIFLRTSKIPSKIDLSDPLEVLDIIKQLFYEKIYRQQDGKNLSLTKRRLYSNAISLFASEIVATQECTLDEACFTIRNSLQFSPQKIVENPQI